MQSDKILSQLENDVEILNKHGFMDYSMFMVVVMKPFKKVDYFKHSSLMHMNTTLSANTHNINYGNINFEEMDQIAQGGNKSLVIGELDPQFIKRADDLQFIILKEQSKLKFKIFHICDPYDIASVKFYEEDRKKLLDG